MIPTVNTPPPSSARLDVAVVIPAAGRSLRYGLGQNKGGGKLAELIEGRSVLAWSVLAFLSRRDVSQVIIPAADETGARELLGPLTGEFVNRLTFSPGGPTRAESVREGLRQVSSTAAFVAVHDAARPAVSQSLITRVLLAAREHGAAGPALPVALTIKQTAGTSLPAAIERTVPRKTLWAMQTPQIIRTDLLRSAYDRCHSLGVDMADITDDLQVLEIAGLPSGVLVTGDEANLKITLPGDLERVKLPR